MPDNNNNFGFDFNPDSDNLFDEDLLSPDELNLFLKEESKRPAAPAPAPSAPHVPPQVKVEEAQFRQVGSNHFVVNISDDDYNAPDELDIIKAQIPAKPRFEVHIEDDDDDLISFEPDDPSFADSVGFQNFEPIRITPANSEPKVPSKDKKDKTEKQDKSGKAEKPAKTKKVKKRNGYHSLIVFFAVSIILTTVVSVLGISCINDILAFMRSDDVVTVSIPADATTDDVIGILGDCKIIKQEWFCKLYNYAFTTLLHKSEKTYKGGVYYVEANLGFETYLNRFSNPVKGAKTYLVTIPEGFTIYQIAKRLDAFGICDQSKFIASLKGTNFSYDFLKVLASNGNRTFKLEGYLYPDTYEFYENDDPNSVIRKMLDYSDEMWTDEYKKRANELGATRDEIMIIASIIEREAANVEQMDEISSVIHNRLNNMSTWPTIDCDSTSTYISKFVGPNVTDAQAKLYANSYNTYSVRGLPPGPICNPGEDAINAALYPADTNYYFFRHDKNGKIYLAETQAEHDRNANLVLRANSGG